MSNHSCSEPDFVKPVNNYFIRIILHSAFRHKLQYNGRDSSTFAVRLHCNNLGNSVARRTAWNFITTDNITCRSQWPLGPRHELSSPAQTLESWVQILLEAWMSMCVYYVFVLFCVYVAALRRADPPSEESYRLWID
jgi:hypothetical protein